MGTQIRTAAIVYGPDDDVDSALSVVVTGLFLNNWRVAGLLQRFGAQVAPGKREMLLDVLPDGPTIRLNDPRGPGVQGCILDTDALARATMAFREAVESHPDLLLASRFGKEEAAGGGMRAELADAIMAGIPLLVPVRANLLSAWIGFLGSPSEVLAPNANAILGWTASHRMTVPVPPAAAIGW